MLAAERYDKIEQTLRDKGSARVTELSLLCGVTEETIRRDLARLEKQGKLKRSHGGAVAPKDTMPEVPYAVREVTNVNEKIEIAQKASQLVQERDFIILDASSTAWYVASSLPNIPLTVLTNSMKVALELSAKDQVRVISTGGRLLSRSLSFVGPLAERSLEQYYVRKAFISCKGIHLERGLSESSDLQAKLKQKMIEIAEKVYVMADFSKFNMQSFAHVASLDKIDYVLTDASTKLDEAELKKKQVEIIRASR